MNKVLIIDDRIERKKSHMSDNAIKAFNDCIRLGYLESISGENLGKENIFEYCDDYSLIAIHKSWLESNELKKSIEEYAKKNQKYLIVFSGGIDQTILLNDYMYLSVNSAVFYTEMLPKFIETYATSNNIEYPLLQLLYDKNWALPIYVKYRQILWKGLPYNDKDEIFLLNFDQFIKPFDSPSTIETMNKLEKTINEEITKTNVL